MNRYMSPKHLNRNVRQFARSYMIQEISTIEGHFAYRAFVGVYGPAPGLRS